MVRLTTFNNNAASALAADIDSETTTIQLVGDGTANAFPRPQTANGRRAFATITNPSMPDASEVVLIIARSGSMLTVERAVDVTWGAGDSSNGWPAGSVIEMRLTAAALNAFVQTTQLPDSEDRIILADGDNVILDMTMPTGDYPDVSSQSDGIGNLLFRSRTSLDDTVCLGGYHVLPILHSSRAEYINPELQDYNMTQESMGGTVPVDLGVPQAWAAYSEYRNGSVVVPTTPNGKQYSSAPERPVGHITTSGVEPVWAGNVAEGGGRWVEMAMPLNFTMSLRYMLMVTEVGFICHSKNSADAPVISIGTSQNQVRFVNQQPLTASGSAPRVFRFPITDGGELVDNLSFRVDTPCSDGSFLGRFYWRGVFIDTWRPE